MSRLLTETGEALYGPRWQAELAEAVGVNLRTVQRWVAGVNEPPPGVYVDLLRLTLERALVLDALSDRLRERAAP